MTPRSRGILVDIDGTLLLGSSGHLEVLAGLLGDLTGAPVAIDMHGEVPTVGGRSVAGFIDAQLIRLVLSAPGGQSPSRADLATIISEYERRYREALAAGLEAGRRVPGSEAFLRRMEDAGFALGLVTGNSAGIARAKLEAVGLDRYFVFDPDLGFGDWREDRVAVCEAAVQPLLATGLTRRLCMLVGDTAGDMAAARSAGVVAVGVLSGAGDVQSLRSAGAEAVLPSVESITPAMLGGEST